MHVTLDLTEVLHLAHDLRERSLDIYDEAEQAVALVGYAIEAAAQTSAPVDTGHLKNSIAADPDGLTVTVTAGAGYADYVERGTSRMAAQPYLRPAFDALSPDLIDAIGQLGGRL